MITFDDGTKKKNIKEHNKNWPHILDHPYKILIIRGWKTSSLFNLISKQTYTDKIYLHAKDPYKAKYRFQLKNEKARLKSIKLF